MMTTEMKSPAALEVCGLAHRYPQTERLALDDLTLRIAAGEMFGILGPNGGGKSTLFRILTTLLRPTAGTVLIFGDDVLQQPARVRRHLGVVFQAPSLDGELSVRENLLHQGHLYGLSGAILKQRIAAQLTRFALTERADEFTKTLSGGLKRRVEIAKALLHDPKLLILDEPTVGLDPNSRQDLWRCLLDLRTQQGMTIVLTTHLMDEAERCDRLAILAEGKLVACDSPANLKARIGGDVIRVEPAEGSTAEEICTVLTTRLGPWTATQTPKVSDGEVRMEHDSGPALVAQLAQALGPRMRRVTVGQPTLDDVFVSLTGRGLEV